MADTSPLARVEVNLNTPPSQPKAIRIETSTSMLGIANSLFDGHACAVQLKRKKCNALPVPLAKTGLFFSVLGSLKRVPKMVPKNAPKMDPKWTPQMLQGAPKGS